MFYDPANNYRASSKITYQPRHDYLVFLNNLNREGLLDPEFLSQTYDQYTAKIASGRVAGFFDETWEVSTAFNTLKQNNAPETLFIGMPLVDPGVTQDSYLGISVVGSGASPSYCISANAKDPEGIFKFFNAMGSDEILALRWWGIEGEHYQKNAEGRRYLTDEQYLARDDPAYSETTGVTHGTWWHFIKPPESWSEFSDGTGFVDPEFAPEKVNVMYNDDQKAILNKLGWSTFVDPFSPVWNSPFGFGWDITLPADDDNLNEINNIINNDIEPDQYHQKMIMASSTEELETLWNELVTKVNNAGLAQLEAYYSEEVQRRINEWK
jgi:ABC-type glycerol-3-phosphate transport system substrate-binding protein